MMSELVTGKNYHHYLEITEIQNEAHLSAMFVKTPFECSLAILVLYTVVKKTRQFWRTITTTQFSRF